MKSKRGRPKADIEFEKLKAIMRLKPTLQDTAAFFECEIKTIERLIEKETGLNFVEFREQNMVHTRFDLIRKALSMAKAGDKTMLIFCLKNQCGWKDKIEHSTEEDVPFRLAYDPSSPKKHT